MTDYTEYDVVLLPTFIQVEEWRRQRALSHHAGLFGTTATTFNAWISDLWELYGDGRQLVDSVQRQTVMRAAFSQLVRINEPGLEVDGEAPQPDERADSAADTLTLSPGVAPLAARCEQLAAGISEFDDAVIAAGAGRLPDALTTREGAFLQGIARYRELLGQQDMVELGAACAWLAGRADEVFPRPLNVLVEHAAPLDWRMRRFFEACPQLSVHVDYAPGADGVGCAPEGVVPRLAFPAGRYATAGLVMDVLRELRPDEHAVITAADPLLLFKQLEPALARQGISAAVQAQVAFGDTDAGRAFLLLTQIVHDEHWDASMIADVLLSPFSGFTRLQANEIDVRLRTNRLADRETVLAELRESSADFANLLDVVGDSGWEAALDTLEAAVREAPARSAAWRSEQLGALAGLRLVRQASEALHAGWRDYLAVLGQMVVSVTYRSVVEGEFAEQPRVLVTTQGAAAQLGAGSCALLVACDLTAADYPLADKDDAASTLFEKLGLTPVDDVLSRSRRTFNALLQIPARAFVGMRPLNDVDGNPAYPSAMLEEFVDACRDEPESDDAPSSSLPELLSCNALERGEELLFANARSDSPDARQPVADTVLCAETGVIAHPDPQVLLPPRRSKDEAPVFRSPSPSQIETFLECPYKWFVQKRLGVEDPAEGFGALEKGTFAHTVLERFYRRFLAEGHGKVTADTMEYAQRIIREEADAVEREMITAPPGSCRLVATNRLEAHEIEQLKQQLVSFLEYEIDVLPGFHPAYLEYEFEAEHAVEYAGCALVGKVDRIDVDDAGRAVIIDYKGSVNDEHDIAGKDQEHPGKVQARIYAQMVKRALGLDVVGTLYLSYGRRHALAGAVDARAIEAAHLPGARKDAVWCMESTEALDGENRAYAQQDFGAMLDATEQLVAEAIGRMERGEVAPAPTHADACKYCPAKQCPKKGA